MPKLLARIGFPFASVEFRKARSAFLMATTSAGGSDRASGADGFTVADIFCGFELGVFRGIKFIQNWVEVVFGYPSDCRHANSVTKPKQRLISGCLDFEIISTHQARTFTRREQTNVVFAFACLEKYLSATTTSRCAEAPGNPVSAKLGHGTVISDTPKNRSIRPVATGNH